MKVKQQLSVLGIFLLVYALLVFSSTLITPSNQLAYPGQPDVATNSTGWQFALASAGVVIVLYGFLGLVAGESYMWDGLVAAMGVHFGTDVVGHVIWPLLHPVI